MSAATVTELWPSRLPDSVSINIPITTVEKLSDYLQNLEVIVQLALAVLTKADQYGSSRAMQGVVEVFEVFPAL